MFWFRPDGAIASRCLSDSSQPVQVKPQWSVAQFQQRTERLLFRSFLYMKKMSGLGGTLGLNHLYPNHDLFQLL